MLIYSGILSQVMPKRKVKDRSLKAVISRIEAEKEILENIEKQTFERIKEKSTKKN